MTSGLAAALSLLVIVEVTLELVVELVRPQPAVYGQGVAIAYSVVVGPAATARVYEDPKCPVLMAVRGPFFREGVYDGNTLPRASRCSSNCGGKRLMGTLVASVIRVVILMFGGALDGVCRKRSAAKFFCQPPTGGAGNRASTKTIDLS